MAKSYYLKTRDVYFKTQKAFREHLQSIFHRARDSETKIVTSFDDIQDLIDYLEDYHNDKETLPDEFNLEDCEFYVKKSPDYGECLWIRDLSSNDERQFSVTKFGQQSTSLQNVVECFGFLIRDIKRNIRKEIAKKDGKEFDEYNLWHKNPKRKELVLEFIDLNNLEDELDKMVSPNGLRNNVPYLMPEYEFLRDKFRDFYIEKKGTEQLNYELKKIKSRT